MKLKTILIMAACLLIGYGLGNVHHSKTAANATKKAEAATKEIVGGVVNGAKEFAQSITTEE